MISCFVPDEVLGLVRAEILGSSNTDIVASRDSQEHELEEHFQANCGIGTNETARTRPWRHKTRSILDVFKRRNKNAGDSQTSGGLITKSSSITTTAATTSAVIPKSNVVVEDTAGDEKKDAVENSKVG